MNLWTDRNSRKRAIVRSLATASVLAVILTIATTPAATADDQTITLTPASQTVEYGQYWSVIGSSPSSSSWCVATPCTSVTMTFTSGSITRNISNFSIYQGQFSFGIDSLLPDTDVGVGTHTFGLSYPDDSGTATSGPNAATVIITPAPLTASTTIVADPNNGSNAIITGQLSGKFIDNLPGCYCETLGLYPMPAGTWNLTVTNSKGTVVLTKQQQQSAGGKPFFVSYWPNVPAGESFTADATFTVGAASSANFTMTDHKFAWTSAKTTEAGTSGTPVAPAKHTAAPTRAGFAAPLWLLLVLLLVAAALIALNIVLLVRRRGGPHASAVVEPIQ